MIILIQHLFELIINIRVPYYSNSPRYKVLINILTNWSPSSVSTFTIALFLGYIIANVKISTETSLNCQILISKKLYIKPTIYLGVFEHLKSFIFWKNLEPAIKFIFLFSFREALLILFWFFYHFLIRGKISSVKTRLYLWSGTNNIIISKNEGDSYSVLNRKSPDLRRSFHCVIQPCL